jgi:gluconolactonase
MATIPTPPLPSRLNPVTVVDGIAFAEGPIFGRDGALYFVNYLRLGTLGRHVLGAATTVWAETNGQANGLKCDAAGRLVVADFGGKRVTRFDPTTRKFEVLTDSFGGQPYRGPNDVCLDQAGNIYFSDPTGSSQEEPIGAVYRISMAPDGTPEGVVRLDDGLAFPNGLAVHLDGRRLYLAETGTDRLLAYDIDSTGRLTNRRTAVQFDTPSLDGMCFDEHARLWIARWVNGSVDVVDVDADRVLASYPIGDRVTNLCWGGTSLYVTDAGTGAGSGKVVRLNVGIGGYDPVA